MKPSRPYEPWTLAIDAVTSCCALALAQGHWLRGLFYSHSPLTLSRRFLPALHALLENVEGDLSRIQRLAINRGPGSFTGLRITFATLRAFENLHSFQVIASDTLTLQVLSWAGSGEVWSMIPSGRTEYALARYEKKPNAPPLPRTEIYRGTWYELYPYLKGNSIPILYPEPGVIPMEGDQRLIRVHERHRVEALLEMTYHPELYPPLDKIADVELLYLHAPDIRLTTSLFSTDNKDKSNPSL